MSSTPAAVLGPRERGVAFYSEPVYVGSKPGRRSDYHKTEATPFGAPTSGVFVPAEIDSGEAFRGGDIQQAPTAGGGGGVSRARGSLLASVFND